MTTERENTILSVLTPTDYDIAGNQIRAYYDAHHKLVFVLDGLINDIKPNVLLVMSSSGDRKWDDVLANDYGVDLETVRPKKDNKYQKLDIEYSGLAVYDDLIHSFENSADLAPALAALAAFRNASSRRAATDRLAAADAAASRARETMAKTSDTIADLQERIKQLRAKLNLQKKEIGKEPTKQSAAKILRTEALIDATNDKLKRAKKRLASAQKRLAAAEDDAEVARGILARTHDDGDAVNEVSVIPNFSPVALKAATVPAATNADTDIVIKVEAPVESSTNEEAENLTEIINTEEPKAEIMADEEVKPLFDTDPEILDEEIAFKPIDFNVESAAAAAPRAETAVYDNQVDVVAPAPLSFVPPTQAQPASEYQPQQVAPVLDTITSVDVPGASETIVEETFTPQPIPQPEVAPVVSAQMPAVEPVPAPMPDVSPAPAKSDFRPVSPITGKNTATPSQKKPTLLYYLMLVVLIVLSVFTLWIYQKSNNENIPDLSATAQPEAAAPAQNDAENAASPFISSDTSAPEVAPQPVEVAPVAQPEPEPEPTPIVPEPEPEPEPSVISPEPVPVIPEPVPVIPEPEPVPVAVETPFITTEPLYEPKVAIPTEEEVLASKPGYNVSQQENMFVAAPDYETDIQYMQQETDYAQPEESDCANGSAPDMYGCCPGETFTNTADGPMCCAGDECFPTIF